MEVIEVENSGSEDSIIELALPEKPPPPVIVIEDEEVVLNVSKKREGPMLAKEFLQNNQMEPQVPTTTTKPDSSSSAFSPNHWTLDMIKFYNDDWGDEDQFIVEKLQEKMDKSPFLWDVSTKGLNTKNKLRRHERCWNCHQRGHHFSVCPEPPHISKCFMCGLPGHLDYYCPNSKCLNCGHPSREYMSHCLKCRDIMHEVCSRCHLPGHNLGNCPDNWRLFHLTTNSTSLVVPEKNIYKPEKDMWCCNCGKRGHYLTKCKQLKNSGYKKTFPYVVSYQRAFTHYINYRNEMTRDFHGRKNKGRRREDKGGGISKIDYFNKAIRKDKHFKNKWKKYKYRNKKQN